ncbi:MAG: glycosyltransferase [Geminicoccaceae bacterium]
MKTPSFDIVIIADWRQAGPVFWYQRNLAEAALAAGYRLATIQVDGEEGEARIGFHTWLKRMIEDGRVAWLDPLIEVDAVLAITVDARIVQRPLNLPLRLKCDINIVIHTQHDDAMSPNREGGSLLDRLETQFRGPVRLAAATDLIAGELLGLSPEGEGYDAIWRPAMDLDAIPLDDAKRTTREGLIVGTEVSAAGEVEGRLFGWRHRQLWLLGHKAELLDRGRSLPLSWRIDDIGDVSRAAFCRKIDAFLEGFQPGYGGDALCMGSIMTAALGGLVVASPKHKSYLGGLAVMSDAPSSVLDALAVDEANLTRTREKARAAVRERHALQCHIQRFADLIGAPRPVSTSLGSVRSAPKRRALFFSTNGVGMGHLTRQLAIARRMPRSIEPVFLSMSQACGQVEKFGFAVEFTPYHSYYEGHVDHWNAHLTHLLHEMIAFYDPSALVFDGNYPFRALVNAREQHPGRSFVWCRRGLWQPGQNKRALERADIFDLIIEPLDLATVFDRGPTKSEQPGVRCIPPIRLLEDDELDDREIAALALGLDPAKPAVLLQLGSRNNYDLAPLVDRLLPALRAVDGLQIATVKWLISEQDHGWPDDVHVLSGYPIARHFAAFDFSIATPGYNTFHELVAHAVPAIFIPNENPSMDDHVLRAAFAERQGFGFSLRRSEVYKIASVINAISRPETRAKMRDAAAEHASLNGAGIAASAIEELVRSARSLDADLDLDIHRRAVV